MAGRERAAGRKGARLSCPLFAGLSEVAVLAGSKADFTEISREFATKGGLNEQVLLDFDGKGGSGALKDALSRVLERITQ